MQSIELYHPTSANLHLTPFSSTNSLTDNVNPLNYQLTTDDFIILMQPDGQLLYTLDPSTTGSLFWALHRLARYITRAASHNLHNDPTIPFASKGYILEWIQAARQQTLQLGPGTGWNWGTRHGIRLEYPVHCLITQGTLEDEGSDACSNITCQGLDGELNDWEEEDFNKGNLERHIILHPSKSAYTAHYPDFNPFAGEPLIDNSYVDSNINYLNTTFVPCNKYMEE
ncbi:uncharacterized protein LACBIDRAFT_331727 [Laccaria bicolor S238N-H82]|uniref:Predicted protein n=1 Tax=Laccaria bicolor (strain S238N-H82 / ATCC MYA-4686) TaxID=486041 RepID=B0DQD1_LACBS|nr:uncharacterized protein LACBIDRAFT_331727 [Laccaria bicolor S238N-H82]EDR03361.1 predicted protein [Laccaria bicolor S238N-H82]|eukprot:XP_001886157.1 predicted protein [Laccaria bicolor S238N-H82]